MPIFYKIIYVAKKASQQSIIFSSECRLLYPWLKMGYLGQRKIGLVTLLCIK